MHVKLPVMTLAGCRRGFIGTPVLECSFVFLSLSLDIAAAAVRSGGVYIGGAYAKEKKEKSRLSRSTR